MTIRSLQLIFSGVLLACPLLAAPARAEPAPQTLARFEADTQVGVRITSVIRTRDRAWYGLAAAGGQFNHGAIWSAVGSQSVQVLYSFTGEADGGAPTALAEGASGQLYGVSFRETSALIFRFQPGSGLTIVAERPWTDDYAVRPALVHGQNGVIYGTLGTDGQIFRIDRNGSVQTVYSFGGAAAGSAIDGLVAADNGDLYGTTYLSRSDNGTTREGKTLFRWTSRRGLSTLYTFDTTTEAGRSRTLSLAIGADGAVYGAEQSPSTALFRYARGGVQLFSSAGGLQLLTSAPDGSLYGLRRVDIVSQAGTPFNATSTPQLDVVKVAADGSLSSVAMLARPSAAPFATALLYADGALYGAVINDYDPYSVLFSVTTTGAYSELARLVNYPRGRQPQSLARATDGSWYGITRSGGDYNSGVVFRVRRGALSVLHSFHGEQDGANPNALTLGSDGNLYVRTQLGGALGSGSLVRVTQDGALSVLHAFELAREGEGSALIEREPGVFYTANLSAPFGALVKLTRDGAMDDVYAFNQDDNAYNLPDTLLVGRDGNFYGTTPGKYGPLLPPQFGAGDIYRVTPTGQFTRLAKFRTSDPIPGYGPLSIVQARDGVFYVATAMLPFIAEDQSYGNLLAITFDPLQVKRIASFKTGRPESLVMLGDGRMLGTTSGVSVTSDTGESSMTRPTIFQMTAGGEVKTLYTMPQSQAALPCGPAPAFTDLHEGPSRSLVAVFSCQYGTSEIFSLKP